MMAHTKEIETLDASSHVCKKFGFESGDTLTYTKGSLSGKKTIIIGVFKGKLWSRDDGQTGVTYLVGDSYSQIQSNYGLLTPSEVSVNSTPFPTNKIALKFACSKSVDAIRQNLMVHYGMSAVQAIRMVPDVAI